MDNFFNPFWKQKLVTPNIQWNFDLWSVLFSFFIATFNIQKKLFFVLLKIAYFLLCISPFNKFKIYLLSLQTLLWLLIKVKLSSLLYYNVYNLYYLYYALPLFSTYFFLTKNDRTSPKWSLCLKPRSPDFKEVMCQLLSSVKLIEVRFLNVIMLYMCEYMHKNNPWGAAGW